MAQHFASGQAQKSRKGLRIALGLGIGGFLLIGLLACVAAGISGVLMGLTPLAQTLFAPITWHDAAASTELVVYEPGFVPSGSGEPHIATYGADDDYRELTAIYPGGLAVIENNRGLLDGGCEQRIAVQSAENYCFAVVKATSVLEFPERNRALVLHKGDTWIALSGATDDELIQVAESLRRVPNSSRQSNT